MENRVLVRRGAYEFNKHVRELEQAELRQVGGGIRTMTQDTETTQFTGGGNDVRPDVDCADFCVPQ